MEPSRLGPFLRAFVVTGEIPGAKPDRQVMLIGEDVVGYPGETDEGDVETDLQALAPDVEPGFRFPELQRGPQRRPGSRLGTIPSLREKHMIAPADHQTHGGRRPALWRRHSVSSRSAGPGRCPPELRSARHEAAMARRRQFSPSRAPEAGGLVSLAALSFASWIPGSRFPSAWRWPPD